MRKVLIFAIGIVLCNPALTALCLLGAQLPFHLRVEGAHAREMFKRQSWNTLAQGTPCSSSFVQGRRQLPTT